MTIWAHLRTSLLQPPGMNTFLQDSKGKVIGRVATHYCINICNILKFTKNNLLIGFLLNGFHRHPGDPILHWVLHATAWFSSAHSWCACNLENMRLRMLGGWHTPPPAQQTLGNLDAQRSTKTSSALQVGTLGHSQLFMQLFNSCYPSDHKGHNWCYDAMYSYMSLDPRLTAFLAWLATIAVYWIHFEIANITNLEHHDWKSGR